MARTDGRACDEMRGIKITTGYSAYAEGSCLIEWGNTKVLCCATVEEKKSSAVKTGRGSVMAEFSLLPRSGRERSIRESERVRHGGRTSEIQRLIARSMRAAISTHLLGDRTIIMDCDVLQSDGGTRAAAVTGAYVALVLACRKLMEEGVLTENPIRRQVAATSIGIVGGEMFLDMTAEEDERADVNINCVLNNHGHIVDVHGVEVKRAFTIEENYQMLGMCQTGLRKVMAIQNEALGETSKEKK